VSVELDELERRRLALKPAEVEAWERVSAPLKRLLDAGLLGPGVVEYGEARIASIDWGFENGCYTAIHYPRSTE
jgi:hypothetical protein